MMKPKLARLFFYSVGVLLFATAAAKVYSAFGYSRILEGPDPVLLIPFRYMFFIAGTVEVIVALICCLNGSHRLKAWIVAWLGTCFIAYRVCALLAGYHEPCKCLGLGSLTDAIHITPETGDFIVKLIVVYMLIGSYALLFGSLGRGRPETFQRPSVGGT